MRASFTMDYDSFKKDYLQKHKVTPRPIEIDIDNLDLSERAKQDVEVRDFVLNHYISYTSFLTFYVEFVFYFSKSITHAM